MKLNPEFLLLAGPKEWEAVFRLAEKRRGKMKAVYRNYLCSTCWRTKRNTRMAQSHGLCDKCLRTATEVHHVTYAHVPYEPDSDIVPLCRECHQHEHGMSPKFGKPR